MKQFSLRYSGNDMLSVALKKHYAAEAALPALLPPVYRVMNEITSTQVAHTTGSPY